MMELPFVHLHRRDTKSRKSSKITYLNFRNLMFHYFLKIMNREGVIWRFTTQRHCVKTNILYLYELCVFRELFY